MTHLSGDETFRKIFAEGRDPYASISQLVLHKDYWDCMEHHEDGTPNPDGKARRSVAKGLMLGILYGMGAKLMSQIIGVTVEECKGILDEFFKEFPKVKEFCASNERKAKEQGYVEDYLGRRRHLPDAQMQEIVVKATQKVPTEADLFFECSQEDTFLEIPDDTLSVEWQRRYDAYLKEQRFGAKQRFKEDAKNAGITVQDNGAFISKTMTQCTNSTIQGSAASLTKRAMLAIDRDPVMQDCKFQLLIPVHDELLGECPIAYADVVEQRLTQLMVGAAKPECSVAMKCDAYVVKHWYEDEAFNQIHKEYAEMTSGKDAMDVEEAIHKLMKNYPELSEKTIREMSSGQFDVLEEDI